MKKRIIKTNEEIEIMKKAGKIAAQALSKVVKASQPQIELAKLDKIAQEEIEKLGATSSFTTVDDYKWTICTTVNEQVVHGIPTKRKLVEGDILGIDIGALYMQFHSDTAITIPISSVSNKTKDFITKGHKTLEKAIEKAIVGNHIGDISDVIQSEIEGAGYSIVKSLTGHGVGRQLHEEPMIPGFGRNGTGPEIKENMVLAIEVIYAQGKGEVGIEKDGWTISTQDGSLGGLFEKTVVIKKSGPIVLTPYL